MCAIKNILVADDDPAIIDALQFVFEDAGYKVVTTVEGETICKMEKEYPDLLLLDIWMSGEDGRKICKFIKSRETTKHIPIIMISANRDTKKMAKESGANDFIEKPFEIDALLKLVNKYTE